MDQWDGLQRVLLAQIPLASFITMGELAPPWCHTSNARLLSSPRECGPRVTLPADGVEENAFTGAMAEITHRD